MIRTSSSILSSRLTSVATSRYHSRRRIWGHTTAINTQSLISSLSSTHHVHLSTTTSSALDNQNNDINDETSTQSPINTTSKRVSFFTEVDNLMKHNVTPNQYENFIQSRKMALNRLNDHNMELQKQKNKKKHSNRIVDDIAMSNIILDKEDSTANSSRYGSSNITQDTNSSFATQQQHTSPTQHGRHEEEEEVPWFKRRDDISNYNSNKVGNTISSTSESLNKSEQTKVSTTPPPNLVPSRYQNLLKHDANDRHKLYNHDNKNKDTAVPSSSSTSTNIDDIKPSGGIFSSISKQSSLNTLKQTNNESATTTRIPLNELFPTLYATNNTTSDEESTTKKQKQLSTINKKLIYNTNHYDDYVSAIETVLDEHGAQRAIKKLSSKYTNKTSSDGESNNENSKEDICQDIPKSSRLYYRVQNSATPSGDISLGLECY